MVELIGIEPTTYALRTLMKTLKSEIHVTFSPGFPGAWKKNDIGVTFRSHIVSHSGDLLPPLGRLAAGLPIPAQQPSDQRETRPKMFAPPFPLLLRLCMETGRVESRHNIR